MKKILFTFLSLVVALTMFAQGESVRKMRIVYDGEVIFYRDVNLIDSVTFTTEWIDLELAETFITMKVGDSYYLNANMPVEKWTSSDENVAIVVNGLITALAEGYTVISATVSGITKTCIVQVEAAEPENQLPHVNSPGNGRVTIALHAPDGTCNGMVVVGAAVNWDGSDDWEPTAKDKKFSKIEGEDNWYQITLPANPNMAVKVVAIDENGDARWATQWGMNSWDGEQENVILLAGDGYLDNSENLGEVRLMGLVENTVVYIDVLAWKAEPCVPKNTAGMAKFRVVVPTHTPEDALLCVVGNFEEGPWYLREDYILTRQSDGTYYGEFEVPAAFEYKYVVGFENDWSWNCLENMNNNRQMPVDLYAYDIVEGWLTLPESVVVPESTIGAFSVGEGKQVTFSKGNLQYTQSTNTWSFAENQYEMLDETDTAIDADTFADKIDLFYWSTSVTNFGISFSPNDDAYVAPFVDWGTNQIGADAPNTWRTLSKDEWDYLLNTRANADLLCGIAQVSGVNGLIFLPDNWTCPSGVTFKSGFQGKRCADCYVAYQSFTNEQWLKMEKTGAVFLPAAAVRDVDGIYWSATRYDINRACCFVFSSDLAFSNQVFGNNNLSVRLVKDLSDNIPDNPNQSETAELCLESADERAVFFQGSELGTSANVYMWIRGTYTDLVGAWPGSAATPMGDGTFKFVVPASVTSSPSEWMIIWNGNGVQTDDLDFVMHGLYNMHGCQGTVTALCEENTPDEPVNNGHE